MHPFLVLSGASEATLRHRGNIHKLYRLYIFLREGHHFVLYVLNGLLRTGLATGLFRMARLGECIVCFQQQQLPNHAWGMCGCIMACTLWLTGPREVSFRVHCFIAELITHTVCECDAPEWFDRPGLTLVLPVLWSYSVWLGLCQFTLHKAESTSLSLLCLLLGDKEGTWGQCSGN